jgi:hypothetical protein
MQGNNFTSRRAFLSRIGITTAAAAAVVIPPAACTVMQNEPELIGMAREMEEAEQRFVIADDAWKAARERAIAAMPAIPATLFVKSEERPMHRLTDLECLRDFDGKPNFKGPSSDMRLSRTSLINRVDGFDALPDGHWARGSELHKRAADLLALDERHAADCERVRRESGYEDADECRDQAMRHIAQVAMAIFAFEPRTVRGLLIQSKALTSVVGLPTRSRVDAGELGSQLALAAERILGKAVLS